MLRVPTMPAIPGVDRLSRNQKYAAAGSSVLAAATLALVGVQAGGPAAAASQAHPVAWTSGAPRAEAAVAQQVDTAHHKAADAQRRAAEQHRADQRRQAAAARHSEQQAATRGAQRPALPTGTPQQIAQAIIGDDAQFQCFSQIVSHESGWSVTATNPSSGSYGLVQALPASKMASAGSDWRTNPATQIRWGLQYMNGRYGSPCAAWAFWQAHSWY